MKWFTWILRRPTPQLTRLCRRCDTALILCTHCNGDWQTTRTCSYCALGHTCPVHIISWT